MRHLKTCVSPRSGQGFKAAFHPLSITIYSVVLATASMNYTNPVYLAIMLFVTSLGILISGSYRSWCKCLSFCIAMTTVITAVNLLASKSGSTIIFRYDLFLFGANQVSLEALLFGLNMGLKLTLVISVFFLYSSLIDPDVAFRFFSLYVPRSSLLAILSSFMLPNLRRDLARIGQTMQTRGADLKDPNMIKRIKAKYPLLKILVLSSLEGSWDTALALNARGFGIGKRTSYLRPEWSQYDNLIVGGVLISFFVFILTSIKSLGYVDFYPKVQEIMEAQDARYLLTITAGFLSLPLAMSHSIWKSSRSKD